MKKFFILVKKETRELITPQLIAPLIVMVVVFSMIGTILEKETKKSQALQPVMILDQDRGPAAIEAVSALEQAGMTAVKLDGSLDQALDQARTSRRAYLFVLPAGSSHNFETYQEMKFPVYTLLHSFSLISATKAAQANSALAVVNNHFSAQWLRKHDVDIPAAVLKQPVAAEEHVVIGSRQAQVPIAQVMGFIQQQSTYIPIILFVVIIMAAQMVAMTMASEKENKTLETLLSLPIGRKTIIFAKLTGAGLVAVMFAGFYMFGLSRYMNGLGAGAAMASSAPIGAALDALGIKFTLLGYALLGATLFLGILVALGIAIILGILADGVKSVQGVTTPLMVLVLLPYLLTMLVDLDQASPLLRYLVYAIPFSHPFLAAQKIMTRDYLPVVLGMAYQLAVFLGVVAAASRIFSTDMILTLKLGRKKIRG